MTELRRGPRSTTLVWIICILGGIAIGVSGFSTESNHPTYLPPGLHLADPTYLARDWWLRSVRHYHYAFFALTVILAKLRILETGLAVLNILTAAMAIHACFRIIRLLRAPHALAVLIVFISVLLTTVTFYGIGNSYLFSPSLQPSSIAAAATIAALADLLERKLTRCGFWLGLAGAFHVNFLVLNMAFFGLAHVLTAAQERPLRNLASKDLAADLLKVLWPSLVLAMLLLPLILSVESEADSPSLAAKADWIFFRFAVPFHYYPRAYLRQLPIFFIWELLGLIWTRRAVPDAAARRVIWAIQIAAGLLIWSATALTTLVFIPTIARLFIWRLAPFAMLIAALVTIIGAIRMIEGEEPIPLTQRDSSLLRLSFVALPAIALPNIPLREQILPTAGLEPAAAVLGGLFVLAFMRHAFGYRFSGYRSVVGLLLAAFAFAVLTQPSAGEESRYSLLITSPPARQEDDVFAFVKRSTPPDALFLIPPDLDYFRLKAARAIIADYKALPINRAGLLEWYVRLEAISGINNPQNIYQVKSGFEDIDAERLSRLRCQFHITHAILRSPQPLRGAPGWAEIFKNRDFRVLASTGRNACPSPASSRFRS